MEWPDALRAVLDEYTDQPMEWGVRDCCQFAARYVKARTGVEHATKFAYASKRSAQRLLIEHDGIEHLVSSCIGPSKSSAEPGDLVVCHVERFLTMGVSNGAYCWTIHPDHGLCRVPVSTIKAAWSV